MDLNVNSVNNVENEKTKEYLHFLNYFYFVKKKKKAIMMPCNMQIEMTYLRTNSLLKM